MTDKEKKMLIDKVVELKDWQPIATPSLDKLLSFIGSIQEEPVSENLQEEISRYFNGWVKDYEYNSAVMPDFTCASIEDCKDIARHFANWQKQQIMKEAVEIPVIVSGEMPAVAFGLPGTSLKKGDKVKISIWKKR